MGNYRPLWLTVLCLLGLICLYFFALVSKNLYNFWAYDYPIEGQIVEWKVVEADLDVYLLKVSYTYIYEGQTYSGSEVFKKPVFQNSYIASCIAKEHQGKKWPIWLHKKDAKKATVQRTFSIELIVKALLALGIFIYAISIRSFLGQRV
jgi:hypothetical protein